MTGRRRKSTSLGAILSILPGTAVSADLQALRRVANGSIGSVLFGFFARFRHLYDLPKRVFGAVLGSMP